MDGPVLNSTEGLKLGDVVYMSTKHTNRMGEEFWWRRFACVTEITSRWRMEVINLKMRPDPDKDVRSVNFSAPITEQVIVALPEERHPPGVIAMRMKMIALGQIKLEG